MRNLGESAENSFDDQAGSPLGKLAGAQRRPSRVGPSGARESENDNHSSVNDGSLMGGAPGIPSGAGDTQGAPSFGADGKRASPAEQQMLRVQ